VFFGVVTEGAGQRVNRLFRGSRKRRRRFHVGCSRRVNSVQSFPGGREYG
jgi:hypothetical protein